MISLVLVFFLISCLICVILGGEKILYLGLNILFKYIGMVCVWIML